MQPIAFNPDVEALLRAANLPIDDLRTGESRVALFAQFKDAQLLGVVALQDVGEASLLRSLAVAAAARGQGLGRALVRYAEQQARARGASAIYLLTTDAQRFFEHLGYARVDRGDAPPALAATAQFSALCPSSSTLMMKRLSGDQAVRAA